MPQYKNRYTTDFIAVHCSATDQVWHGPVSIEDIREWHKLRGWIDVGYHFYIRRNGIIEPGRPLSAVGAHVRRFNLRSVGVCLEGGVYVTKEGRHVPVDDFTEDQRTSLESVLRALKTAYPDAEILGHCDFPGVHKACPSFDVREFIESKGIE